jgi:hypothetical protein
LKIWKKALITALQNGSKYFTNTVGFFLVYKYQHIIWFYIIKIVILHLNVSQVSWFLVYSNISIPKKFKKPSSILHHSSIRVYSIDVKNFICILIVQCSFLITNIFMIKLSHFTLNVSLFKLTYFPISNHFASSMTMNMNTNVSIWSSRLDRILINFEKVLFGIRINPNLLWSSLVKYVGSCFCSCYVCLDW